MYTSTRAFVEALDSADELERIGEPVSPILEISRRADAQSRRPCPGLPSPSARAADPRFHHLGGKALLFENVEGSPFPLLINAYGSYRRMELALGCTADHGAGGGFAEIARRLADLTRPEPPRSLSELFAKARQFLPLLRTPPRRRRPSARGPCQEVVLTGDAIDLRTLPIIRCWPHDGDFAALGYPPGINDAVPGLGRGPDWDAAHRGRYITLAGIHTIHADERGHPRPASHNIGMYRVQLLGPRTLAMHWHMHHDGARHWRSWKARGEPMPVAIALGGESVLPYAATAPLPPGISELLLAGFLHGRGIDLVRARTVPLWVPANAEFIVEGFVSHEAGLTNFDPRRGQHLGPGAVFEGPFGDHTGFYSLPDRYPVLTVTALTHRRNPIYPTTVVGLPPQEDYFLGKATERIFLPLLRTLLPDIEDYDLPMFGAFHNAAFIKIRKSYPLHARKVMHGIWGAGQMSWTKSIVVVDHDVDVHDHAAVLRAAAAHAHPQRDLVRVDGPLDILDHAAPRLGAGTKLGLDATRKWPDEALAGPPISTPPAIHTPPDDQAVSDILADLRALPGVAAAAAPAVLARAWLFVALDKARVTGAVLGAERADRAADAARSILNILNHRAAPDTFARFIVLLGPDIAVESFDDSLFHWCANADAGRDTLHNSDGRAVFDATPKHPGDQRHGLPVRDWPPILRFDFGTP